MAAPNLKNPTTITGKTAAYSIGAAATKQGIVTCGSSSNKVLKINSILCANDDSAVSADVTVSIYDGTNDINIAKDIQIPAHATQIISSKETYFYLEEGTSLRVEASAANDIDVIVGYEEIS